MKGRGLLLKTLTKKALQLLSPQPSGHAFFLRIKTLRSPGEHSCTSTAQQVPWFPFRLWVFPGTNAKEPQRIKTTAFHGSPRPCCTLEGFFLIELMVTHGRKRGHARSNFFPHVISLLIGHVSREQGGKESIKNHLARASLSLNLTYLVGLL